MDEWQVVLDWISESSERMARVDITPSDGMHGSFTFRVRLFEFGMSGPPPETSNVFEEDDSYTNYEHVGHGATLADSARRAIQMAKDHAEELEMRRGLL